jgi:polysaccharide biosynthesis protein PslG
MRAAGATSVRVDYYGQPINDQVVSDAVAHGLHVLVDPTRIGSYPGDCTASASRYGQLGVRWFELGNEPNINNVAPAYYAAQAKACAAAIRAVLPDAVIVLGGLSNFGVYPKTGTGSWNPVLYLEQVLSALNGNVGWISAVSFHPYGFCNDCTAEKALADPAGWGQIAQASPSIVSTEARYGVPQKVWITEHGAPTDSPTWTGGMSEAEQARLVTSSVAAFKAASWAGVFFWYSGRDRPSYDSTREGHFGLLRGDWTEKPAYAAFAAAVSG